MLISIYYEIPLFVMLVLLVYFVIKSFFTWKTMSDESFGKIFFWLIMSGIAMILFVLEHLHQDLIPYSENTTLFLHFVVSHGFLLVAVIFLAIAGNHIGNFGKNFGFK